MASKSTRQEGNAMNSDSSLRSLGGHGGVYILPFKSALMMMMKDDESSVEYQRQQQRRFTWDALCKSINGLVNKVSVSNIKNIIPELF